jgi:hypothetical protein
MLERSEACRPQAGIFVFQYTITVMLKRSEASLETQY